MAQRFSNPEMCRITELLIFEEPYQAGVARNRWTQPQLDAAVAELQASDEVRRAIEKLKVRARECDKAGLYSTRFANVYIEPLRFKPLPPPCLC